MKKGLFSFVPGFYFSSIRFLLRPTYFCFNNFIKNHSNPSMEDCYKNPPNIKRDINRIVAK